MYQGSCLCGTVHYEVRGEIGAAFFCHCSRCRKANGSAFASNAIVQARDFVVTRGESAMKTFSVAGVHRVFCGDCGSPLISRRDALPELVRLRLGTLDTPPPRGPGAHIFAASKAPWFEICDALPQHPEWPPA